MRAVALIGFNRKPPKHVVEALALNPSIDASANTMNSVAINHYTSKGNFRRAATHKQNLAEVYEVEIGDQKKAIESYELAASWFENDNAEA